MVAAAHYHAASARNLEHAIFVLVQHLQQAFNLALAAGDFDHERTGRKIDHAGAEMKKILAEIQDGTFATNWIKENETWRKQFDQMRSKEAEHSIEEVGSKLRAAMPFLDPVTVTVDSPGAAPRLAEPVGA